MGGCSGGGPVPLSFVSIAGATTKRQLAMAPKNAFEMEPNRTEEVLGRMTGA